MKSLLTFACALAVWGVRAAETLAVYPFDEGAAGESAVGVTLKNAADAAAFAGSVSTDGAATFSDLVPGKYVYQTDGAETKHELVASGIRSICMTDGKATVSLAGLSSAMGALGGDWTLELFYLIPANATDYAVSGAVPQLAKIAIPVTKDFAGTAASFLSCAITANDTVRCFGATVEGSPGFSYFTECGLRLNDGCWHHLAVQKSAAGIRVIPDYRFGDSLAYVKFELATPDEGLALLLGNGAFKGYIACPRVSRGVVPVARLLRATSEGFVFVLR